MTDRVSFSGRSANLLSTRAPGLLNWFSRRQAGQFERSGGKRGAKLRGKPIFRLTVVGRNSGQPRSVMLMLVRRGDDLLVCGSQAGTPESPNWWKNLVAAGRATAQVGPESYEVAVRAIEDEPERSEAWSLLTAAYPDFASYQALTDRVLPIAALTRTGS
jgi:deazaflavin-dependent oxidoreductase (nitroreductase family)